MDSIHLQELLQLLRQQNGGVVLQEDGLSRAVLLSIDRYYQLIEKQEVVSEKKLTIVVTGGAGYIGAHVVRYLLKRGHAVVVIDNFVTGKPEFVPLEAILVEGSVADPDVLERAFAHRHVDVVMHFAASLEVAESVERPLAYFENNVLATQRLLEAMVAHAIPQLIFSSTGAVYGDPVAVPIPETAVLKPGNPYGQTKLLAEQIIEYYARTSSIHATVFRYFNVCGADPESNLGDTHALSHLIPVILEVAHGAQEKFIINGNDYETFDGTCVRDYVHVLDIVQAHLLALDNLSNDAFRVYNVGTGKGFSVEQMVTAAAEVLNRMIPLEMGPRRPGDAAIAIADTAKIVVELGFKPTHSDLETIFKTTKY